MLNVGKNIGQPQMPPANLLDPTPNLITLVGALIMMGPFAYLRSRYMMLRTRNVAQDPRACGPIDNLMWLTILITFVYVIDWYVVQKVYGWTFDTGANGILPHGYSAIWLSLSLTVPVVFVPVLYGFITGRLVVSRGHFVAAIAMMLVNILTNLLLYGFSGYQGTVNNILDLKGVLDGSVVIPTTNIFVFQTINELVNAFLNVGLSILCYGIVINYMRSSKIMIGATVLRDAMIGAIVTFFPIWLYIVIKYPASLDNSAWINVRGEVASVSMAFAYSYVLYYRLAG